MLTTLPFAHSLPSFDTADYLLGVIALGLLVSSAWLGTSALRFRLVPNLSGAPAHLATAVLSAALLIWAAEALGTFGLFKPVPYVIAVLVVGVATWTLARGWRRGGVSLRSAKSAAGKAPSLQAPSSLRPEQIAAQGGTPHPDARPRGQGVNVATLIAFAIAAAAIAHFAAGVRLRLSTGMTGFDSTWYHGPFAAGFFQTGNTFDLHFIAPQFLAWFYPANAEIFHAVGMLAFSRDILSPLLNLGWFGGCLVAVWCIGRPFGVAPLSLALGAVALSVPAFADQAGEARNDIVGTFFLLAAVAVALNAWADRPGGDRRLPTGALVVVGLAIGLAAGTKLNFLLPAAALVVGLVAIAPRGQRLRALVATALAALAGGGYWYLRNLLHAGNPLPWVDHLGPIALPAPQQGLGGREAHSVFGYLTNGSVWSDWFLPGLHGGLGFLWPLLVVLVLTGLALCLGRSAGPLPRVVALTGFAVVVAWLVAPTSASGPDGVPRGFESGLRYLAPALVLGLALLPVSPPLRARVRRWAALGPRWGLALRPAELSVIAMAALLAAAAFGGWEGHRYLEKRYADPRFSAPGLNETFARARNFTGTDIATTSTRQYPLYGTDLSNRVQFVGLERSHGGFVAPSTCRAWRRALNAGDYDFVVASRDRIEPGKPPYPPQAGWTASDPAARLIFRKPPTALFVLLRPLHPRRCR
jgi:hypothetical protein